jgi:photosystem II stability/assembly factor-like uncharacterized protein
MKQGAADGRPPLQPSGLMRSDDGGMTFAAAGSGLEGNPPLGPIAVDPLNPDIVYIATFANGLYRSADGGVQWTPLSAGVASRFIHTIAIRMPNGRPHAQQPLEVTLATDAALHRGQRP